MKILAGLLLFCATVTFAYPSLLGASGVVELPTAKTIAPGMYVLGVDGTDIANGAEVPVRVLYGLADNLEVGAAYLHGDATDRIGANAKLNLPTLIPGASTAVGMLYLHTTTGSNADLLQPYIAITRTSSTKDSLFPLVQVTVGTNVTQQRPNSSFYLREFGCIEAYAKNGLVVGLEYQGSNSGLAGDEQPLASAVLRYPISQQFAAQLGVTNADGVVGSNQARLFVGVSYTGGKNRMKDESRTRYLQLTRNLTAVWSMGDSVIEIPVSKTPYGSVPYDWGTGTPRGNR